MRLKSMLALGLVASAHSASMAVEPILAVSFSFTDSPVHLVDPATGIATFVGNAGFNRLNSLAKNNVGQFYSVGGSNNDKLITLNPTTGAGTLVSTLAGDPLYQYTAGLAFSPSNTLYATVVKQSFPAYFLTSIDINTGAMTTIGNGHFGLQSLAISSAGIIYSWDMSLGNGIGLVTLDPVTGALTDVNVAEAPSLDIQALAFDSNGVLYGAADNRLYQINTTNGAATFIGAGLDGPNPPDYRGIEFVPEPASLAVIGLTIVILQRRRA